mgnify:CR=1 FL=1
MTPRALESTADMADIKQQIARRALSLLLVAATLVLALAAAPTQARVGEVLFVRGPVTAQSDADPRPRFLGRGDEVREGDVITTGNSSHVALGFVDEGKVTLRPGTLFKVEEYAHDRERNEGNALLRLFKGGLRTLTGLIGKSRPDSYRVSTPVATIGIRGTRFDARLCEAGECQTAGGARDVGRIAFMRGEAFATRGGRRRVLDRSGDLYEGDVVETAPAAIAVLVFRDDTRVTLQGGSRFVVEKYQYREEEPEQGNMLFRFVRGGLRVLTGLVAKERRDNVRVATPVATIGIRGTGFDGVCQGKCFSAPEQGGGEPGEGDGMFFQVWEGGIFLEQEGESTEVNKGQTFFAQSPKAPPQKVPGIPPNLLQKQGPRPDKGEFRRERHFGPEGKGEKGGDDGGEKGPRRKKEGQKGPPAKGEEEKSQKAGKEDKKSELFVSVKEGKVAVSSKDGEVEIGAGQAGVVSPGQPPKNIPRNRLPLDFMGNTPPPDSTPNSQKGMEPCQIR